jgi:hypothetical protein
MNQLLRPALPGHLEQSLLARADALAAAASSLSPLTNPEGIHAAAAAIRYLLEVYRWTQAPPYLRAAQAYGDCLLAPEAASVPGPYGLYRGRAGIACTLVALSQVAGVDGYATSAIRHVKAWAPQCLHSPYVPNDLFDGKAGVLVGLLHLHAHSADPALLDLIRQSIAVLLGQARLGEAGVYWENGRNDVNHLCGFGHGHSGMAFAFLEAGYYFQNEAFYALAERILAGEDACYHPQAQNWPDWRKHVADAPALLLHRSRYLSQDRLFFAGHYADFSHEWGATGIALTRLRAHQLLGRASYREAFVQVYEQVRERVTPAAGPSPGDAMACWLLRGAGDAALPGQRDPSRAVEMETLRATGSAAAAENRGASIPFSLGDAAMAAGYACLAWRNGTASHVFNPVLPGPCGAPGLAQSRGWQPSGADIQKILLENTFPATGQLLGQVAPGWASRYAALGLMGEPERFFAFLLGNELALPERTAAQLADLLALEQRLVYPAANHSNQAWLYIHDAVLYEQAKEQLEKCDEDLLAARYVLNETVEIVTTQWDWFGTTTECSRPVGWLPPPGEPAGVHEVAIKQGALPNPRKVCLPLRGFNCLLSDFATPVVPQGMVEDLLREEELTELNEAAFIRKTVTDRLRYFLNAGFIVPEK